MLSLRNTLIVIVTANQKTKYAHSTNDNVEELAIVGQWRKA
jgi:hypothetical protein